MERLSNVTIVVNVFIFFFFFHQNAVESLETQCLHVILCVTVHRRLRNTLWTLAGITSTLHYNRFTRSYSLVQGTEGVQLISVTDKVLHSNSVSIIVR